MPSYRVYEVQNEIVTRKWMYEVEAPDKNVAMSLVRDGQVEPIDCGTMGEPFYAESGFAVQPHDADSNVGWEDALNDLDGSKPTSAHESIVVEAIEAALDYFEETRHGKEWINTGGVEAKMLREALNALRAEGTV